MATAVYSAWQGEADPAIVLVFASMILGLFLTYECGYPPLIESGKRAHYLQHLE
jgi:hypothetical protein